MALFAVEESEQCSEAVMKDSPSAISVGPGSFKVTPWVFSVMSPVLLPSSSSCTRSERRFSAQKVIVFGRDEAIMIDQS